MIKTYFYNHSEKKMYHDVELTKKEELLRAPEDLLWIDLYDIGNDELQYIAQLFDFHPLAIEDTLHVSPRAKVDKYDDYNFFVFHALRYNEESDDEISTLELNVFLGDNYVVTIHRSPLAPIGKIAAKSLKSYEYMDKGSDYLLYALVDGITDEYFPVLDRISVRIDELEDEMFEHQAEEITEEFLALKRTIILIRRVIVPQRRIFSNANGRWSFEIAEDNIPYYIDLVDHLERISDSTETYRELVNSALDTYFSIINGKTSEIIRVLTIISTIMMPLTFITGFFGMNVPLPWQNDYISTIIITIITTLLVVYMLYIFRKRHWI